jgi:hypothetical protein
VREATDDGHRVADGPSARGGVSIIESSVYDGASARITGQHLDDRVDYHDPG